MNNNKMLMTAAYRQALIDTQKIINEVFENSINFYDKKIQEIEKQRDKAERQE